MEEILVIVKALDVDRDIGVVFYYNSLSKIKIKIKRVLLCSWGHHSVYRRLNLQEMMSGRAAYIQN